MDTRALGLGQKQDVRQFERIDCGRLANLFIMKNALLCDEISAEVVERLMSNVKKSRVVAATNGEDKKC